MGSRGSITDVGFFDCVTESYEYLLSGQIREVKEREEGKHSVQDLLEL